MNRGNHVEAQDGVPAAADREVTGRGTQVAVWRRYGRPDTSRMAAERVRGDRGGEEAGVGSPGERTEKGNLDLGKKKTIVGRDHNTG
jgi:hypothetical protein